VPQDNSAGNPEHVASHHKASLLVLGNPLRTTPLCQSPLLLRSGIADQTLLGKPSGTNSGQRQPMPIFDHSASRPGCAEANLPQSVPGPAKPSFPSLQLLSGDFRGRQRRASVKRALVVLALLGLFCGSAAVMSERPQPPPGAAPVWLPAAAQAPVRAHAKARTELPASESLTEMTYCLWSEAPGEPPAASRVVAEADIDSGALHARSC